MQKIIICLLILFCCTSCRDSQYPMTTNDGFRMYGDNDSMRILLDTATGETWFLNTHKEHDFAWYRISFIEYGTQKDSDGNDKAYSGKTALHARWNKENQETKETK